MKAKILSVTPKPYGDGKTLYKVITAEGKEYTCFSQRIKDMIGQEVEFEATSKDYKGELQWTMNLPKEGGKDGYKKQYIPEFQKTIEGAKLSAKTMLLSYVKDMAVEHIEEKTTWTETLEMVETGFKRLVKLLDLDKLQEAPKQAPVESTQAHKHTLSVAKQAIIAQKCKQLNFRAKDLIDMAALNGLEIHYDPSSDKAMVESLGEEEGAHLIQVLQDLNR